MKALSTWIALAVLAVLGVEIGLAFRTPAPSPNQVLQQVFTAAGAADAFHYTATWRTDGVSQIVVGDAAPSSGSEAISVGGEQFSVVFTGKELYFDGDGAALRDQLGFPEKLASENSGRWISLEPSDGPFPSLEEGLTTSAALAQLAIAPSTTSTARRIHGVLVSQITGAVPHGQAVTGSASLDLIQRSKLPVSYAAHGSYGGHSWSTTIAFSRWNEKIGLNVPPAALAFSSLQSMSMTSQTS